MDNKLHHTLNQKLSNLRSSTCTNARRYHQHKQRSKAQSI